MKRLLSSPRMKEKRIPPKAIQDYLDSIKGIMAGAYQSKRYYDLGKYYFSVKQKLIDYYGVGQTACLYDYMSLLLGHGITSIAHYIKAALFCQSLGSAFSEEYFNSLPAAEFRYLALASINPETKRLIVERKISITDINNGVEPGIFKPATMRLKAKSDLLKEKVRAAQLILSEIETLLSETRIQDTQEAYDFTEPLLLLYDGAISPRAFKRRYSQKRGVTMQAGASALSTLEKRGLVEYDNEIDKYQLSQNGWRYLQQKANVASISGSYN